MGTASAEFSGQVLKMVRDLAKLVRIDGCDECGGTGLSPARVDSMTVGDVGRLLDAYGNGLGVEIFVHRKDGGQIPRVEVRDTDRFKAWLVGGYEEVELWSRSDESELEDGEDGGRFLCPRVDVYFGPRDGAADKAIVSVVVDGVDRNGNPRLVLRTNVDDD